MRFRTVGLKLSLALVLLVAGALVVVYVAVVPTLKDRLLDSRIEQLERTADAIVSDYFQDGVDPALFGDFVAGESQTRGARVAIYSYLSEQNPVFLRAIADSRLSGQTEDDPIAQRAAEHRRTESGIVERGDSEFAEVAVPFDELYILLVSSPVDDTLETVSLVRERLVVAGVIALLAAALVGFLLARVFAQRIRRLERAADRIAGGRFDEPVVDPSADELGELARAFDRMREQLATLERARREFIANASHELRTPIFALGGHVELLTEEDMDEATRSEFLGEMRLQVERLTKLATDLLDLSRLDAGRLRVELAPVDLGEIASSLASDFEGLGRGRDHVVVADVEPGMLALADEERVRQIGRILLENAIVHTPPGTEVRLTTAQTDGGVELRVEDTGPGIRPADQKQIFERFYRADGVVTAGSGLGLAIGRELAGVMHGEIALSSRPGRTVFTLKLPRVPAPVESPEPALTV
ncbi:MAG TPA: HAMP domain-containing sensor histidine kinase [Gaiellaceae bacterium]|jgi:signal transduction histidine kinase|nr:HAMP domain-containing sensor histidine kinase [Gaiellaceae bacterium]